MLTAISFQLSARRLGRQDYHIYQCEQLECGLRFPAAGYEPGAGRCPACGGPTGAAAEPLRQEEGGFRSGRTAAELPHLVLLLDNIRSTYNVGSILRTADGAGVREVHLCGITATPDHPKVAKTALGAAASLPWRYHANAVNAGLKLAGEGYELWALEGTREAESLYQIHPGELPDKLALALGHEVIGIDPELLPLCRRILALPMVGIKESLNVTVACGAAVYWLLHGG